MRLIKQQYYKYSGRIIATVLLFTFFSVSLLAQEEGDLIPLPNEKARATHQNIQPIQDFSEPERLMDTLPRAKKEKKKDEYANDSIDHSPRKAMIYSMALPGLGQGYNKKYFKIPIVYGVLGGVVYWIAYNNNQYKSALADYNELKDSSTEFYVKSWRRQLEISYLTFVGAYALQVVDAYVDAHLFHWDVGRDLTLRVDPQISPIYIPQQAVFANYGIKLKFTF